MLTAILLGLLRHALTTAGGSIAMYGLQFVNGILQVHSLEAVVTGGVITAVGATMSVLEKVKTQSGPIYKTNQ